MTVRALLEKLQEVVTADPSVADRPVWTEGCDCAGELGGVMTPAVGPFVYLYRAHGDYVDFALIHDVD